MEENQELPNVVEDMEFILKLSVRDRLLTKVYLPTEGKTMDLLIGKSIIKLVDLSNDEMKKIGLKENEKGDIEWDVSKEKPKKIIFNQKQITYLRRLIEENDKKISLAQLPEYFMNILEGSFEVPSSKKK